MYRGYTIGVRGEIPGDIVERVSKLHGAALSKNTSTGVKAEAGNDTLDNKEDGNGDTTQVTVPELCQGVHGARSTGRDRHAFLPALPGVCGCGG